MNTNSKFWSGNNGKIWILSDLHRDFTWPSASRYSYTNYIKWEDVIHISNLHNFLVSWICSIQPANDEDDDMRWWSISSSGQNLWWCHRLPRSNWWNMLWVITPTNGKNCNISQVVVLADILHKAEVWVNTPPNITDWDILQPLLVHLYHICLSY